MKRKVHVQRINARNNNPVHVNGELLENGELYIPGSIEITSGGTAEDIK
jgi:hypothetical protein